MKLPTVCALIVLAGCGSKKEGPPPPPYTGALTADRILAAKDVVKPLEPWARALAKLEAQLGKPTKVDGEDYQWAVVDGDNCTYIEVSSGDGAKYKKEGLVVDMVQSPMTIGKDGPIGNRADCLEIAGKTNLPAEDPDAAGPPADGVVAPADFEKLALAGRSKWEGKPIKITGKVTGIGGLLVNVDGANCIQKANADASLLGQTVTAEGTVRYSKGVTGAGEPTLSAELGDCVISGAAGSDAGSGSAGSGSAGSGAAK